MVRVHAEHQYRGIPCRLHAPGPDGCPRRHRRGRRKADGTLRSGIVTHVAPITAITTDTWQTQTITFAMPLYTVVDQTDYLDIDLLADATSNISTETVSLELRIDDPTFDPLVDQMRAKEIVP